MLGQRPSKRVMPDNSCLGRLWMTQTLRKPQAWPLLLRIRRAIHAGLPTTNVRWYVRSRFALCARPLPVRQEGISMSTHHISVTINGQNYEGDVESRLL